MKIFALLLILFIAGTFCQTTLVQWGATVNTTSSKGQFRNRIIRARLLDGANIQGGLLKSIERTLVSGEVEKNGIRFAGYAINPNLLNGGAAPTAVSAYFSKQTDVLNNTADGNGVTFEVSKASNFVAVRFFSLEEVDTNGNVVNTIRLRGQTWSIVNSSATTSEQVDVRLPYVTIGATVVVNGTNNVPVQISFIATADLVTINIPGLNGGPIVPPKGLEVIFAADLTNYPYANTTNYLRLVTFTATGSASRSTNVTSPNPAFNGRNHTFITSVVNDIPINIRFDQRGSLSGNRVFGVNPSNSISTSYSAVFNGTDTNLQIDSFFGANVQLTRTDVPFPVNAKELVIYDPTVSVGTDPTTTSSVNFGSVVSVSALLLILCILAQLF